MCHNLAFSQTNWSKYSIPVLERSASFPDWKGLATADACVIRHNDTLKMWFVGSGWMNEFDDCPHVRIGYAWSMDGIVWNEYAGNPVLDIGTDSTDFDYDGVETPTVIFDEGAPISERYKMWYAGRNSRCSFENDHKLGYAISPDGVHWTKYEGNPVFQAGPEDSWFNSFVSSPTVIKRADDYQMWFTAPDLVLNDQPTDGHSNIGFATSTDGVNWDLFDEPVLIAGSEDNWDSAACAEPSVVYYDNHYYMFYSALDTWDIENFQVGFAFSTDGVHWSKAIENPVLTIGEMEEWDAYWASHPAVLFDPIAGRFEMWYTGRNTEAIEALEGYYWDIGFASTPTLLQLIQMTRTNLRFYPNPCFDFLTIQLFKTTDKIEIHSISGSSIDNANITYSDSSAMVDFSETNSGIYLITIVSDEGSITKLISLIR